MARWFILYSIFAFPSASMLLYHWFVFYSASLKNSIDETSNGCKKASFASMQQNKLLLTKSNMLSIFGELFCSNRHFHSKIPTS